jgi:hypothetical protein
MNTTKIDTQSYQTTPIVTIRTNLDSCCYEIILDTSNPTTQISNGQRFTQRTHFTAFNGNQKKQLVFLFREMANLIEEGWEERIII